MIGNPLGHPQTKTTHHYAYIADDLVKAAKAVFGTQIQKMMKPRITT